MCDSGAALQSLGTQQSNIHKVNVALLFGEDLCGRLSHIVNVAMYCGRKLWQEAEFLDVIGTRVYIYEVSSLLHCP